MCLLGSSRQPSPREGAAGEVELAFSLHGAYLDEAIEALGDPPLPPYIAQRAGSPRTRSAIRPSTPAHDGAVAAPTAGLHFTPRCWRRSTRAASRATS